VWIVASLMVLLGVLPIRRPWAQIVDPAPSWLTRTPIAEKYLYQVGEGIDVDLSKAQVKARADGFKKFQMAEATGTTSPLLEQVDTSELGTQVESKSAVAFSAAQVGGIEVVAEYDQVVPINGLAGHHHYILMRRAKPEKSLIARGAGGIAGRLDAVVHSAIWPGWGEWRQGRRGEAVFFAVATPLAALTTATLRIAEKDEKLTPQDRANFKSARKGAMYATLGLYGANLVMAIVGGHHYRNYEINASPGFIRVGRRF